MCVQYHGINSRHLFRQIIQIKRKQTIYILAAYELFCQDSVRGYLHAFSQASFMPRVCRRPLLEFKDPVIKSVCTSHKIKLLSLRNNLAFSESLNVWKINDDDSTCNNVITFSMVIFQAHKQMDFIYFWKIKQFNTWCLRDLSRQQVALGDLQNIVVIILLNLHIVYLFPQQGLIVAFCKRYNCYV